jgi:hypothetical protein
MRHALPSAESVESAIAAYQVQIASIRADGLLDGLPEGEQERISGLGFVLQQLQQNLSELAGCLCDWACNPQETATHAARRALSIGLARMDIGVASAPAARRRGRGLARGPGTTAFARAMARMRVRRHHA